MRRKRYIEPLGVTISRAVAQEAKRAAKAGRSNADVVVQICLLAGVPPLRLPADDEGREGILQRVLGGYEKLVDVVKRRLEAKLSDDRAQLEMVGHAVFEMHASGGTIARGDLAECYASLAPMLGKNYAQDVLDAHARLQTPAGDTEVAGFLWLFLSGPMAELELPQNWWWADEPAGTLEIQKFGVLKDKSGIAVEYTLPHWDSRTAVIAADPPRALDEHEMVELINTRAAHMLTPPQRAQLVEKLQAAGEWETVEVERDEVDPENPGWSALSSGPDGLNLNKVPETLLDAFKDKMEEGFRESVIAPDDPRYKYDSRAEFSGDKEDNEWDDSDDE